MEGLIGFHQLKVRCTIGVHPHEHQQEQEIFVDLKVKTDFGRCAQSDVLSDTIDYASLAAICTQLAQSKHYQLLETYAWDVLHTIFTLFPITWAWVGIQKPAALSSCIPYVELEKHA